MELYMHLLILAFHLLRMIKYAENATCNNTESCTFSVVNHTFFKADCSDRQVNSTAGLCFNDSVIDIDLSNNNLQIIRASNPFPKCLMKLDLSSSELFAIESGALRRLKNLTHLDVSNNIGLTLNVLPNITNDLIGSNIKSLKFNRIQCPVGAGTTLRYEHLCRLQNTSLSELELSHNRIDMVEQFTLLVLPTSLKSISAGHNRLRFGWYFLEFGSMKGLRFLNISDMYATENPFKYTACLGEGDYKTQNVSYDLKTCPEIIKQVDKSIIPKRTIVEFKIPNLETLIINNCVIHETGISKNLRIVHQSLKRMHANNNFLPHLQYIDYSQKLEEAYLSKCYINDIDDSFFLTTNFSILDLSHNNLGNYLATEEANKLLQRQVNLKYLNLSKNRLRSVPINLFQNLKSVKVLNISDNHLIEVNFTMRGLKQLTTLDLSGNRLIALSETTLEEIDILGQESPFNLTLNLSGNPFQCTCDTLYFLKWIESKKDSVKNVILKSLKNDSCSFANLKERSLSEISTIILELEKVCFSKSVVIVLSVILIIVFFFIIIIGVFHRYRWKLRYIYYLTRRSLRGYFNRQNGTGNRRKYFEFDAFISYAEEDRTFAFECLTSEILDRQPSLKLCYHHIHFLPGSGIAENIVNAVHNSRKTICVLSKHFLVSEWCLYEFNMANFEKIYNRGDENSLIILILGHVSYDRIPVTMMSYLQSTSYIEVPEENDDRRVFWNNICDAIHDD